MRIRHLVIYLLAALLCSCASTSLKQTWKSPEYQKGPVNKVAAVAVDDRGMVRQAFENRFVSQLEKHGTSALTTFNLLSPAEIKADKAAAVERLQAAGADSVLIVRLVDSAFSYSEVHVGNSNWGPYDTWYDYFALAYGIGPSYGSLEQTTCLETSLFELKSGKRIWSGLTDTVSKYNTDRLAEIDKVVAKVIGAMRKDGIIH
jgi:hypothetical protein